MEPWPSDVQLFQPYEVSGEQLQSFATPITPIFRWSKSCCQIMPLAWRCRLFSTWLPWTSPSRCAATLSTCPQVARCPSSGPVPLLLPKWTRLSLLWILRESPWLLPWMQVRKQTCGLTCPWSTMSWAMLSFISHGRKRELWVRYDFVLDGVVAICCSSVYQSIQALARLIIYTSEMWWCY